MLIEFAVNFDKVKELCVVLVDTLGSQSNEYHLKALITANIKFAKQITRLIYMFEKVGEIVKGVR